MLYALAMVLTRTPSRHENPLVLALLSEAMAVVLGAGSVLRAQAQPRPALQNTMERKGFTQTRP